MKGQLRIDEMFAFIVLDDDGTEGVVAFMSDGNWMPLVGGDMARVESLKPLARMVAGQMGKKIKLVKFTNREILEIIE